MEFSRVLIGLMLSLAGLGLSRLAVATTSDSSYTSPDLQASTGASWGPAKPVPAARGWETALRLPGRIVSLPLVAMGYVVERSVIYLEETGVRDKALTVSEQSRQFGIVALPATLGDHTGVGGEVRWSPHPLQHRLRIDVNAATSQYNRERVTRFLGPFSAVYVSEWRPRELYFGPGLSAPRSGESAYGERTQAARLLFSWGWQRFDSTRALQSEPLMFRDRVRLRGRMHRTWVSAWAGPREEKITRGRDPDSPSFEVLHPVEAAGSLNHGVEYFSYGFGLSDDARWGQPHWSRGWRASFEAERYDKSIPALAFNDAHTDARSFTRLIYHAETGMSFGRDPRTLRLELTALDQHLDAAGGTFLIGDLRTLGSGAGLAGFEYARFRDLDLVLARLTYLFPLVKNFAFELHTESGGVYPDLKRATIATFRSTLGAALRLRTERATLAALGCDWSSEQARVWFGLGGFE